MLMLGRKYAEIADTQSEPLFLNSSHSFSFHMHSLSPFSNTNLYNPDIGTILKHHFLPAPYPPPQHSNPFCPYCLRFVAPQQPFLACRQPLFQKTYLAHSSCLAADTNNCLNSIVEVNHASLALANGASETNSISIGEKEYYVQMELAHSLTNHKYFTLNKKINSNGAHLIWNFKKYNETSSYFPNIIAFPYPDFDLTLSLTKLTDKTPKNKIRTFVNTQKLKCDGDRLVRISTDEFDLLVNIINSKPGKESAVQEMNFKYKHPIDIEYPLIQLVKLQLKLNPTDSEDDQEYICSRESSSITQILNQNTSQVSVNHSNSYYQPDERSSRQSEAISQRLYQRQKIDLPLLISNNLLGQYVRNNVQSRNFQAFLSDVRPAQLDQILQALSSEFSQLVTHQYANYMMQKLFKICNEGQRLFILQRLLPNLHNIAMNKQGTHTLQSLVALFTHQKQEQLTVQRVCSNLLELAYHNNATHFVQKIIDLFPVHIAATLYSIVANHFVEFSLNKNAMCVIKHMMMKLKQFQDKNSPNQDQLIKQIKKSFVTPILLNFNKIIQDAFGNYVIQFCYEYFGDCSGITDNIIERFPQYSTQKYSGSVVQKCLQKFWTHKQIIQRLKNILHQKAVLDMYRNKQGNKILLTIMEQFEGTVVRERIYGQLLMAEPSKFMQDRWGVVLGCRSGTVGTYYNSFSEAVKPTATKKKKNYNIIQ